MPDAIFAEPRLARIYDAVDGPRTDLDLYLALAEEFAAREVLDIGCGTGTLACLLAARGKDLVALDPAAASLEVAKQKPFADKVRWICGTVEALPSLQVELVTMTGNVAQVFTADDEWQAVLRVAHEALRPGGHLVFEVRDPARRAWLDWTPERSRRRVEVEGEGTVETWTELVAVREDLVTFNTTFSFLNDASLRHSQSTLRFRGPGEISADLSRTGFEIEEIRDAPDRAGLEFVFVAARP